MSEFILVYRYGKTVPLIEKLCSPVEAVKFFKRLHKLYANGKCPVTFVDFYRSGRPRPNPVIPNSKVTINKFKPRYQTRGLVDWLLGTF